MEISAVLAPYPPANIRLHIAPEEWTACLDAWLALASMFLRLPDSKFGVVFLNDKFGVIAFIKSYIEQTSQSHTASGLSSHNSSPSVHKTLFLLCHRILSLRQIPPELTNLLFLADFSRAYQSVGTLPKLLNSFWNKHSGEIESQLQATKKELVTQLDDGNTASWQPTLHRLNPLLRACPQIGSFLALGSDLVDSAANSFARASEESQQTLTIFTYLLLISLALTPKPNYSVLSEHLYTLKVNAKLFQSHNKPSLLTAIVSETHFINQLQNMSLSGSDSESSKGKEALPPTNISAGLQEFIDPKKTRSKRGKAKTNNAAVEAIEEDVHFHRMSKVIKIQEIFPDYGSGFVTQVLREYNDDEEVALNHLLSDSLPPHLADADKSEQFSGADGFTVEALESRNIMEPRGTPPTGRRSKFDNDELDNLEVDASRLHIGKARQDLTADDMLSSANPNKNAIYNSLAAFDVDDDERDDSYDAADVGGTVDNTVDGDRSETNNSERILYQNWKSYPMVFARDAQTRKSIHRSKLKQETGWTDEAIEGWAVMLEREPRRKQALERRFADDWQGQQRTIQTSRWIAEEEEEEEEDLDGEPRGSQRGGRPHRGAFRGRGRGNPAGPSGDSSTQKARRGKEVRGTHNRREGRAKKVARGMGGPA
jgi:activating signal cointegrator complex subunit 2